MDNVIIWGNSPGGPHVVRTHGTLLTFAENPTDIDLSLQEQLVRVRFEFSTDPGHVRGEYSTDAGTPGDSARPAMILLRFYNLSAGVTFSDGPIRLATVGAVGLWLAYEVTSVIGNRDVKKISYTLWDGTTGDTTNYANSTGPGAGRG
jgi:hypothetical protein